MIITNKTKLNLVIGRPLVHSQSPLLHNFLYKLLGINAVLLAQAHTDLTLLINLIKELPIKLTAVTMPYKERVIKYLDAASSEVAALKAVNTIINKDNKLHGYNTDIDGIAFALRNIELEGKSILILGAGGAARALGYYLKNNNAKLFWLNRTKKKAAELANLFGGDVITNAEQIRSNVIINATSIGMLPNHNISPLPDYQFEQDQVVFDMVYNPVKTQMLKSAMKGKAHTISGINMFIGQGIKQIELLTNNAIDTKSIVSRLKKFLEKNQ